MAVGCGAKCAKFLLIVFNAIFWLSGIAVLGVGIWLLVDKEATHILGLAIEAEGDSSFKIACYILIGIGSFVCLVGFLGCCGAIKENKCMLGLYIFALVLVFIVELAAGIVAAVYKDKITSELKDKLSDALKNDGNVPEKMYYNGDAYTAWGSTVNFVQAKFKCCGFKAQNGSDYDNFNNTYGKGPFPYSCCMLKNTVETKNYEKVGQDDVNNWVECQMKKSPQFYTENCFDSLQNWVEDHLVILIGVGIGIACLELFGFIFAVCLCRNTGDKE